MIALLKSDRFGMEIKKRVLKRKVIHPVKIRPFRYGNIIKDPLTQLPYIPGLKSDRFGMEILYNRALSSLEILNIVKIRPFRYGNIIGISAVMSSYIPLKSDRFGMEMLLYL